MMQQFRAYPFHEGEQDMHFAAGAWQEAESLGWRMIKHSVSGPHADLLRLLPLLFVTAADGAGRLWASALAGQPGMVAPLADDATLLEIQGARLLGDGALRLHPGQQVGCLGLLFTSRRRVRVNGTLREVERGPGGLLRLLLWVDQCYTNCPRYIQKRTLELDAAKLAGMGTATPAGTSPPSPAAGPLPPAQQAMVRAADTFFIASSSGPAPRSEAAGGPSGSGGGPAEAGGSAAEAGGGAGRGGGGHLPADPSALGCDLSHRGGMPGFVQVLEGGRFLKWADYEGNFMFNTLGNLLVHPPCALLFPDFDSGGVLMVAGQAEVLHKDRELPGAQRAVQFSVQQHMHLPGALPFRQVGPVDYSPFNPPLPETGSGQMHGCRPS